MSPSDISRIHSIASPRPVGHEAPTARTVNSSHAAPDKPATTAVRVETSTSFNALQPPVDQARVAEIRTALKQGNYPLHPTRIADAMIAALLLLSAAR